MTVVLVACSSRFNIDGMWRSEGGKIVSFQDGVASPTLFGFSDGPNGSYSFSEEKNDEGYYTLFGTHLTGGSVEYQVEVIDNDHIVLTLDSDGYMNFAPQVLKLERQ